MAGITDAQRELVLSMAAAGKGRNEIARTVGVSAGSVSNIIKASGLSFDRAATEVATKSRKIDLAERRSQLEADYLADAQRLRALLWQPMTYRELGSFGGGDTAKYSEFVEYEQSTPTPIDQLKLMQASTLAMTSSQKIADAASDQGTEAAKSMLAKMAEGLAEVWRDVQATE